TNDELLHLKCDILIPAAFENQIRNDNVAGVRAKVIAEAANGPTTPSADAALFDRGIPVIPDILANSGGVTVSYFEWVQNIENEHWSEDHVNEHLREKMEAATDAVLQMQIEIKDRHGENVDLRTAAFALAIKRVASVALVRGIWPSGTSVSNRFFPKRRRHGRSVDDISRESSPAPAPARVHTTDGSRQQ